MELLFVICTFLFLVGIFILPIALMLLIVTALITTINSRKDYDDSNSGD